MKEAALAARIKGVFHHTCSCGVRVGYVITVEGPFLDPNCYCTDWESPLQPRTWDNAAAWINGNEGEQQKEIAARFGLTLEEADA